MARVNSSAVAGATVIPISRASRPAPGRPRQDGYPAKSFRAAPQGYRPAVEPPFAVGTERRIACLGRRRDLRGRRDARLVVTASSRVLPDCSSGDSVGTDPTSTWMRPAPRSCRATDMSRYGTCFICSFSIARNALKMTSGRPGTAAHIKRSGSCRARLTRSEREAAPAPPAVAIPIDGLTTAAIGTRSATGSNGNRSCSRGLRVT